MGTIYGTISDALTFVDGIYDADPNGLDIVQNGTQKGRDSNGSCVLAAE
ncbi:hypothetical protein DSL72_001604 [Monilinia vaccinii-corymbosi]|uniref:Uncharacterized protein n=1 Tax=Monilinia vaccinii-corymbosi TaxID=61207 RepID=A0A8A3P2C6_9HELO|nr:hypothetical protein DSL72_001604 [Monilinia vaccinii-corymbosi]